MPNEKSFDPKVQERNKQEHERIKQRINAKTERELREEFRRQQAIMAEIKQDVDDAINNGEIANKDQMPYRVYTSTDKLGKVATLREAVAQTVVAIAEKKINLTGVSAQAADKIITHMHPDTITPQTSPYIYELLQRAIANQLESPAQFIEVLKEIENVRYLNENFYAKVVNSLQQKAGQLGMTENQRVEFEILKTPAEDVTKSRDTGQEINKKFETINSYYVGTMDGAYNLIKGIKINPVQEARIRQIKFAEYAQALQNKTKNVKDIEILIQLEVLQKEQEMKGNLSNALRDVSEAEDKIKRASALQVMGALVGTYNADLDPNSLAQLNSKLNEVRQFYDQHQDTIQQFSEYLGQTADKQLERLVKQEMERAGVDVSDKLKSVSLLASLYDKQAFKRKFELEYVDKVSGQVKWDQFNEDVIAIFEDILSVVDNRPVDFFDQAFNQILEGNLYKQIQKKLQVLGKELQTDSDFKKYNVEIEGVEFLSKPTEHNAKKSRLPHGHIGYSNIETVGLGKAIESYLYNDSQKLYRVTEYLHNVEVISTLGLGFEQLANYAKRVESGDIDWIMRRKKFLPQAYAKYITNLQTELASNQNILRIDFGRKAGGENLDPMEETALRQLVAENPLVNADQLKRQVRMASAISKGFTGEFWGLMQATSMPMLYMDQDGKVLKDKDSGFLQVASRFLSVSNTGVESMMNQLNLDILLERFVLPNYLPWMRYAYSPRDLHNVPNPWSEDGQWDHTKVMKYGLMLEDALFNGRSHAVKELDRKYLFMRDHLKTGGVDLFTRGGWRFEQIEALKVYLNTETALLNYDITLLQMKKLGRFAVKTFIDQLCGEGEGWKKLNDATLRRLTGKSKAELEKEMKHAGGSHGHGHENSISALKRKMYQELIFDRMIEINPTRFIGIESRRYTPRGEETVLHMLKEHMRTTLSHYPPNFGDDKVLRMYLNGLEMVEKKVWWSRKDADNVDYIFGLQDIEQNSDTLRRYYRDIKGRRYKLRNPQDSTYIEILESEEAFIENIKGLHIAMRKALGSTQHRLTRAGALSVQDEFVRYNDSAEYAGRKKENLSERYTEFMFQNYGNLNYLIGGDDFDFGMFKWETSGNRPHQRMFNEVNALATKMNPALAKIITSEILEFAKGQYADVHAYEAAVQKHFVPGMKEIYDAINQQAKDQADEYVIRLEILLANVLAKDTQVRIKFAGDIFSEFRKKYNDMQPSLLAEYLADTWQRPITSLDSNQIKLFGELISNACNISFKETKLAGYTEGFKVGPFTFGRFRIAGAHHKISHEMYEAGVGSNGSLLKGTPLQFLTKIPGVAKLTDVAVLERHAPMVLMVLLLILAAMAKLAGDKNKGGKH